MSMFDDLLKEPLPSATMTEGADDLDNLLKEDDDADVTPDTDSMPDMDNSDAEEGCDGSGDCTNCEGGDEEDEAITGDDLVSKAVGVADDDDDDEDDIDDMTDEEIDQLDKDLSGDSSITDREQQVTLTPEEEKDADDIMALAATTSLVNSELNAAEKKEFAESYTDRAIACNEGFMTESDFDALEETYGETLTEAYNQKMIIRLDAASKKKQLHAIAVNASAAAHNDPDYIKYKKICALKRKYREKLEVKYAAEASKRERIYWQRLQHSKAKPLAKIAKANA